ncbi:hypothetical protein [Deinococcus cellulosilyticus]|nr:hypothetical protein [Deinococcus cellulosilyticus]
MTLHAHAEKYQLTQTLKTGLKTTYATFNGKQYWIIGQQGNQKGIFTFGNKMVQKAPVVPADAMNLSLDFTSKYLVVRGIRHLEVFDRNSWAKVASFESKGLLVNMGFISKNIIFETTQKPGFVTLSGGGELLMFREDKKAFSVLSPDGFDVIDFDSSTSQVALWGTYANDGKILHGNIDQGLKNLDIDLRVEFVRDITILDPNRYLVFDDLYHVTDNTRKLDQRLKSSGPNASLKMPGHTIQWKSTEVVMFDPQKDQVTPIYKDKTFSKMITNVFKLSDTSFAVSFDDGTLQEYALK